VVETGNISTLEGEPLKMTVKTKKHMTNLIGLRSRRVLIEQGFTNPPTDFRQLPKNQRIAPTLLNEGRAVVLRYADVDRFAMTDALLRQLAADCVSAGFDYVEWRQVQEIVPVTTTTTAPSTSALYTTITEASVGNATTGSNQSTSGSSQSPTTQDTTTTTPTTTTPTTTTTPMLRSRGVIYASSARDSCLTKADVVFLLDGSGSVSTSNFALMKSFVNDVIDGFDIGLTQTRIGAAVYSVGQGLRV
jgi:hypothetical protein